MHNIQSIDNMVKDSTVKIHISITEFMILKYVILHQNGQ